MQADILVRASHLHLITEPAQIAAAKSGTLFVEKKPVLIIRGIPAGDTIRAVYALFASRTDMTGSPFRLSHREKGMCGVNQWQEYSKLTSKEFAKYLVHWAVLMDLTTYDSQPALVVVRSLPPMLIQLFHQPRYLTESMLSAFQWID
jgi:hypothetical protein